MRTPEAWGAWSDFDRFFEENGYKDGEEPQAFADFLALKTGKKIVGLSKHGAVEGHPPTDGSEHEGP